MPRRKSLITVIRELVQTEIRSAMASLFRKSRAEEAAEERSSTPSASSRSR